MGRLLIWAVTIMVSMPALADRCDFPPFLLGDDTLLPMPGMRDGQLIFEDAAICRALPALVPPRIARHTFWLHQLSGAAPEDVVPLGGGMLAPKSRMGCRTLDGESTLLFENGRVRLLDAINDAAADHSWRLPAATGGHREASTVRSLMPTECWPSYAAAVERAVFQRASTAAEWLADAAYMPDGCIGDDFRWALRGLLNRALSVRLYPPLWAPVGECFLRGSYVFDDRASLGLYCPGDPERIVITLRPHLLAAFVGANQGMTADATIHPMDETCLSAWATWRAHRSPNRTE